MREQSLYRNGTQHSASISQNEETLGEVRGMELADGASTQPERVSNAQPLQRLTERALGSSEQRIVLLKVFERPPV